MHGRATDYTFDLPSALMHFVHITSLTNCPFLSNVTFCRFGFQSRFVARCENERLCPKLVVLPQFEHLAILLDPFR